MRKLDMTMIRHACTGNVTDCGDPDALISDPSGALGNSSSYSSQVVYAQVGFILHWAEVLLVPSGCL